MTLSTCTLIIITVVSPLAASYVDRAATDAGTVAVWPIWQLPGKQRNTRPYLQHTGSIEPIAVENLGFFSSTTLNYISELGRRICVHTDVRETS